MFIHQVVSSSTHFTNWTSIQRKRTVVCSRSGRPLYERTISPSGYDIYARTLILINIKTTFFQLVLYSRLRPTNVSSVYVYQLRVIERENGDFGVQPIPLAELNVKTQTTANQTADER